MEPTTELFAGGGIDWASAAWALLIAGITAACLAIKSRYERIAAQGRWEALFANLTIGYFGLAMAAFGAVSALRAHLPVPGGVAWEGPVAVMGGLAAFVVGTTTLAEHAVGVARRRAATLQPARIGAQDGDTRA